MTVPLENPGQLHLSSPDIAVLHHMFQTRRRVIIQREYGNGLSGGRVFQVLPVDDTDSRPLSVIVKIAPIAQIEKEQHAYQDHIAGKLPFTVILADEPVLLHHIGWGGLCFSLHGGGIFEIDSLYRYILRPDAQADQIVNALRRLLTIMNVRWRDHDRVERFCYHASYAHTLPVDLLVVAQTPTSRQSFNSITPDALPAQPISVGEWVQFSGFVVNKVNLATNSMTLTRPQRGYGEPSYYLRYRTHIREELTRFSAGELVDVLNGCVQETRTSRLHEEVVQVFAGRIDPHSPLLEADWLGNGQTLIANPLAAIDKILATVRPARVAPVHCDLNLENILLEPHQATTLSIIDFAETRRDHVIHDLLRLETEIVTKLVPMTVHAHDLELPAVLTNLYWQLDCIGFQRGSRTPTLPHPELNVWWEMLHEIRCAVPQYLVDADDVTEYYQGLFCYLLGALKFKNLNELPQHPLPKRAAFWSAALVYQFLLHRQRRRADHSPDQTADFMRAAADAAQPTALPPAPKTGRPAGQQIQLSAAEPGHLPDTVVPPPSTLTAGSRMTLDRNRLFVGRRQDLLRIANAFNTAQATAADHVSTVAITGPGGMGKSQLTVEFAHRYAPCFPGGVFWLSFADKSLVPTEVAACGGPGLMELRPDFTDLPLDEQVALVRSAWTDPTPRLLIFDNCEDPSLLAEWRPASGGCMILVSSRRAEWHPAWGVRALALRSLSQVEGLELLRIHQPDVDDEMLAAIAQEVGYLPLALHMVGSYLWLHRRTVTPKVYLAQLRDPDLLETGPLSVGDGLSPTGHDQNIWRTIALSFNQLDTADPIDSYSRDLLARAAGLAPGESIPFDLLCITAGVARADSRQTQRTERAVHRLVDLGLMRAEQEAASGDLLRVHQLIVRFVQTRMSAEMMVAKAAIAEGLSDEIQRVNQARNPGTIRTWQAHIRFVLQELSTQRNLRAANLLHVASDYFWQIGDYQTGFVAQRRALILRRAILGTQHPGTALCFNGLGIYAATHGDYDRAAAHYKRALTVLESAPDVDELDLAATLNNLGFLHQSREDFGTARQHHERALQIRRKRLGDKSTLVAESLSNLAFIHFMQDQPGRARSLLERALAIREELLGEEHPDTARTMCNLGELLLQEADLPSARSILLRGLAIRERTLGSEHPQSALSLYLLGCLHQAEGDLVAARACFERAVAIQSSVLGKDHPDTVVTRHQLALLNEV